MPALAVELADVDDRRADGAVVDRDIPVLVADGDCAGLVVSVRLGVHGRALELAASSARKRSSVRPDGRAAGTLQVPAAFGVAHPIVHCKIGRADGCSGYRQREAGPMPITFSDGSGSGLIAQAREAFLPAQHGQHVENRRRGGPAGQRGAQGLRHGAELDAGALGKGADSGFGRRGAPVRDGLRAPAAARRCSALRLRREQRLGLVVEVERAAGPDRSARPRTVRPGSWRAPSGRAWRRAAARAAPASAWPASSSPPAICGRSCSSRPAGRRRRSRGYNGR